MWQQNLLHHLSSVVWAYLRLGLSFSMQTVLQKKNYGLQCSVIYNAVSLVYLKYERKKTTQKSCIQESHVMSCV